MKSLISFVIVFVALTGKAQTSVYHPFPTGSATWTEAWFNYGMWQGGISLFTTTGADTLIDTTSYKQFFRDGYYMGGYRQDSATRSVYFIPHQEMPGYPADVEFLWYDFSVDVGDTSTAFPLDYCPDVYDMIVTSVDSVLVDGNYHKAIFFEAAAEGAGVTIVEGIGSLGGVFRGSCFELLSRLCMFEDGAGSFENWGSPCNVGLNEQDPTAASLYPTPAKAVVYLRSNRELTGSATVVSLAGQLIASRTLQPNKHGGSIDISGIETGIYLVFVDGKAYRLVVGE